MKKQPLYINDPVYGFITVARGLHVDIITHPYFQRLNRISQMGLSSVVYPGAKHTRFLHSLGAYHLVTEALKELAQKGEFLFDADIEAAQAAILLHDVGHGPFSHVLEKVLVQDVSHEAISLLLMQKMNVEMRGALTLAIEIFKDNTPKHFLHQLLSSQLDVDRMDYLCRDSFYTGVREGDIGASRLIKVLNVVDDQLVVDMKGLYSVENYLIARRAMFWQVYLHKTTLAADALLQSTLQRAKDLAAKGKELYASPSLHYFLYTTQPSKHEGWLEHYVNLDDSDILSAVKVWQTSDDRVLALLSSAFVNRKLFKAMPLTEAPNELTLAELRGRLADQLGISDDETLYFYTTRSVEKAMYDSSDGGIKMLSYEGNLTDISEVSHLIQSAQGSHCDCKQYLMHYPL